MCTRGHKYNSTTQSGVQTDKEVLANGTDIAIRNKKDNICLFVDSTVQDRNIIQKKAEEKLKYKI
jgi:hypothetical protein